MDAEITVNHAVGVSACELVAHVENDVDGIRNAEGPLVAQNGGERPLLGDAAGSQTQVL